MIQRSATMTIALAMTDINCQMIKSRNYDKTRFHAVTA